MKYNPRDIRTQLYGLTKYCDLFRQSIEVLRFERQEKGRCLSEVYSQTNVLLRPSDQYVHYEGIVTVISEGDRFVIDDFVATG